MSAFRQLALITALLASNVSFAQDDETTGDKAGESDEAAPEPASTEIRNLLDSIPQIETKPAPADPNKPPPPPEPIDFTAYMDDVRAAVLANWAPSSGVLKKNPKAEAQVLVKVDDDGDITEVGVIEASGIKAFDKSMMKALENTGRVPPPPSSIAGDAARGIVVTFSARGR